MSSSQGDQQGYSLLELMITAGIIAILAGIALPGFNNVIKHNHSTSLAYAMMGLVQFARTESVSKSTPVTLCGSSNGSECNNNWSSTILIFVDRNGDGKLGTDDTLLKTVSLFQSGETLAWRSFRNKAYLQMEPYGMTYYQNGNFTYCPADRDAHFAVHWILNTTGHLRIASDNNGNGIPEDAAGKDIAC